MKRLIGIIQLMRKDIEKVSNPDERRELLLDLRILIDEATKPGIVRWDSPMGSEMKIINEALGMAVAEGAVSVESAASWTDEEKEAWYEKQFDFGSDQEEIPY